jgi:hypothetical protein
MYEACGIVWRVVMDYNIMEPEMKMLNRLVSRWNTGITKKPVIRITE